MEATPVKELITDNVIVSSNDEATLVKKSIKAGMVAKCLDMLEFF